MRMNGGLSPVKDAAPSAQHCRSFALILGVARLSLVFVRWQLVDDAEVNRNYSITASGRHFHAINLHTNGYYDYQPPYIYYPPQWSIHLTGWLKGILLDVGPKWLKISLHLHFPNDAARLDMSGRKWICFAPGSISQVIVYLN